MKVFKKAGFIGLVTVVCSCASQAYADATITFSQVGGQQSGNNVMIIKDGKIRFTTPNQGDGYSLYDGNSNSIIHIMPSQRKYISMDEKTIAAQAEAAKKQMEAMRQQMEQKMKSMPPEQRKQMEQMMAQRMPQMSSQQQPKIITRDTGKTETVAGINCTIYEATINGQKVREICAAPPSKIGLSGQDHQTLQKMQDFMKKIQQSTQGMMGGPEESGEIKGLPLQTKNFGKDGSVQYETRLSGISTNAVAADQVSIPAGYSLQQMPSSPHMK